MSNRYAIHLETPAGLQFDGMVEADSLYEAAMKWARDIGYEAGKARLGIAVQDPNYNEEGKLRFSALSAGDISDVYGATECIYVASEFDPKALFREMAIRYEKPAKDAGIDTWTGMRVFELLNIPGLTCHEGAWQALPDEQRARCESIARAINRNSAPRSGLLTGELLYKSLQRADDDLKVKAPLCAWEMQSPAGRKFYESAASLLSESLSPDLNQEPAPGSDESKQNIPDRFDAAGFEWLQNEILNDLQRRVDTSPELEMKQAFRRAGFDVVRTFSLMRRAIHLAALSSIRVPDGSAPAEAPQESAVKPLPIQYPDNLS